MAYMRTLIIVGLVVILGILAVIGSLILYSDLQGVESTSSPVEIKENSPKINDISPERIPKSEVERKIAPEDKPIPKPAPEPTVSKEEAARSKSAENCRILVRQAQDDFREAENEYEDADEDYDNAKDRYSAVEGSGNNQTITAYKEDLDEAEAAMEDKENALEGARDKLNDVLAKCEQYA